MLSHKILKAKDLKRVGHYYQDGIDDYYAKDNEASKWQGKGAELLNLRGKVEGEKFVQLLSGKVDFIKKKVRLSKRDDSNDRIGIDFTFSAPKSVSMQALINDDLLLSRAHDKAVKHALKLVEAKAETRKKEKNVSRTEKTGNLIIAKFNHELSRELDPQLHTHAIIMNLTKRSDGNWRALKNDEIIKSVQYFGVAYRAKLATELVKLGYELKHGKNGTFELAHITRKQIENFSKRSRQIEELLANKGLDRKSATTSEKQYATLETRARKISISRKLLLEQWQTTAKDLEINFDGYKTKNSLSKNIEGRIKQSKSLLNKQAKQEAAKRAVKFAINHLMERSATIGERTLINTALKQAVGTSDISSIRREISQLTKNGYLVRGNPLYIMTDQVNDEGKTRKEYITELVKRGTDKVDARNQIRQQILNNTLIKAEQTYTTKIAISKEKAILAIERSGRSTLKPILESNRVDLLLNETNLNPSQKKAARLMLTTNNLIIGVQGSAGVGKSHMLKTAIEVMKKQDYQVIALAPYNTQVKNLNELGIEAKTLASFLHKKDHDINSNTVLIIDEAGLIPTRQMVKILKLAEKHQTRVALVGDTKQMPAIEAGKPFKQLKQKGIATELMNEIHRQKNKDLKKAVELAALGKTNESVKYIKDIVEIKNNLRRFNKIALDYAKLPEIERDSTLVVSGTNAARRTINEVIRSELKLVGKGKNFDVLSAKDMTLAEKKFSRYYDIGDYIEPQKDYLKYNLKKGLLYKIEDIGTKNKLIVKSNSNKVIEFDPKICNKISVFQHNNIEISSGDVVRATRSDKSTGIANSERFKIKEVSINNITLVDDKQNQIKLSTNKELFIDHAYATTVHSSQSLTSDKVIIDIDTKSPITRKNLYYVAISRARHVAKIYTDNEKVMPKAISRENIRLSALDILRGNKKLQNRSYERDEKG